MKYALSSPHIGRLRRVGSPMRGSSTFTTSAPRSASTSVAHGPANILVRSITRMPASGGAGVAGRRSRVSRPASTSAVSAPAPRTSPGFGRKVAPSGARNRNGEPTVRRVVPSGAVSVGVIPRATVCGSVTAPSRVSTGPAGTSAAAKIATHSSTVRSRRIGTNSARSSCLARSRREKLWYRSSRARSSRPAAVAKLRQNCEVNGATTTSPSAASNEL